MTLVCGDSHTATHGAFGALAFGIGTTEVEHVLATQTILQKPAKNMRVTVRGERLPLGVVSKDLALHLCGAIGKWCFSYHSNTTSITHEFENKLSFKYYEDNYEYHSYHSELSLNITKYLTRTHRARTQVQTGQGGTRKTSIGICDVESNGADTSRKR